jgi:hypothetical protein
MKFHTSDNYLEKIRGTATDNFMWGFLMGGTDAVKPVALA